MDQLAPYCLPFIMCTSPVCFTGKKPTHPFRFDHLHGGTGRFLRGPAHVVELCLAVDLLRTNAHKLMKISIPLENSALLSALKIAGTDESALLVEDDAEFDARIAAEIPYNVRAGIKPLFTPCGTAAQNKREASLSCCWRR